MNDTLLDDIQTYSQLDFISDVSSLSESILLRNWVKTISILEDIAPVCLYNDYSFIRSEEIKIVSSQIYREFKHAKRVSIYAKMLAIEMACTNKEIIDIEKGGFFHDIGKLLIDQRILYKESKLSDREWKIIKNHPRFACELLSLSRYHKNLIPMIEQHHEKWDGTGYPNQLQGLSIKLPARILSVVDAYDAMTCNRSYHHRIDTQAAVTEIKRCSGSQFDADIAAVFTNNVLKQINCSSFRTC